PRPGAGRRFLARAAAGALGFVAAATIAPTAPSAVAAATTRALPGNAPLSAMATARPATLALAEEQFLARTPARFRTQQLVWGACPGGSVPAEQAPLLECTSVRAPRDWRNPADGDEIGIAVSRLRRSGARPARIVVINPGGPGNVGLATPVVSAGRPQLAATSDAIGIDVRGTGSSTRATCGISAFPGTPDPRDRSAQALAVTAAAMQQVATACRTSSPLAPYLNTEQTVADIDLVRALLGRAQLDFVGYSAGTWLGAQYATYFPARVGRFVLDSVVDVTNPWQQSTAEDQPMGFQRRFRTEFQPLAATYDAALHLGRTPAEVEATYERMRSRLRAQPLDLTGVGVVDGNALDGAISRAMYGKVRFRELAEGMSYVDSLLAAQASASTTTSTTTAPLSAAAGTRTSAAPPAWTPPRARTMPAGKAPRMKDTGQERRKLALFLEGGPLPSWAAAAPTADEARTATLYNVVCNDTAWAQGADAWNALGQRQGTLYPVTGWAQTRQPCGYWERPPLSLPRPDGRDLPPVLLVASERDAATPLEGVLRTHQALPSSRLVTVRNEGDHVVYASIGNPCVDGLVDRFLATGAAPTADTTCEGTGYTP
ncbi:alpha/beta hydrolase, partial [Kineococcus indalonis]|uniref:alpha/beta hydrolase n=1 Tax=Kineococcus indalonis TaxID=2696566 RepID=UPI0014124B1F